jgi:hypothetical protein
MTTVPSAPMKLSEEEKMLLTVIIRV